MFFVVGNKVYLAHLDTKSKVYREVRLVEQPDGSVALVPQETGSATKPKRRRLCTAREVLAQFGGLATAEKSDDVKVDKSDDVK